MTRSAPSPSPTPRRSRGAALLVGGGLLVGGPAGCGLFSEPPPPAPEPLPLVVPTWLQGEWTGLRQHDGRLVAWLDCGTAPEVLDVLDGGSLRWRQGDRVLLEAQAVDVRMEPDASMTFVLPDGARLSLVDEEDLLLVAGDRPAGATARRFGRLGEAPVVEAVPAPCEGDLPRDALAAYAGAWSPTGDPCEAAALVLDLAADPPTITRGGGSFPLRGARPGHAGSWLSIADGDGDLHGLWLHAEGDRLEVRQPAEVGLARQSLVRVEGTCGG